MGDEPSAAVRIETPRLVLRELRVEDWPEAQVLDRDPLVVRYQLNDVLDEEGTKKYLASSVLAASQSPRQVYDFALCLKGDDRLLGRVGLRVERPEHREAMVWFNLRRDHWRRGLASEALRGLIDFGFSQLGLHRLYGDCDPRNVGSSGVMEKVGMRREAHLRENWWVKGEWCDSFLYAVLEQDWPALRSAQQ